MKKELLFVLAILLLFSSCKQRYKCQFYSEGEPVISKPYIIRADSDEAAYKDFIAYFDKWIETGNNEKKYIDKTITLEVLNCKTGKDIAASSDIKPEFFAIQGAYQEEQKKLREERERIREQENQEAINAWDDVKFGITKQQALKTKAFKNGKISKGSQSGTSPRIDEISMTYEREAYYRDIMGLEYNTPTITAYFGGKNADELFKIELKWSGLFKESHYESLRRSELRVRKILEEKYNKKFTVYPSYRESEVIKELNSSDGFVYDNIGYMYCGDGENGRKKIEMKYETSLLVGYKQLLLTVTIDNNKYPTTKWEVPQSEKDKIEAEKRKKEEQREKQKTLF